MSLIRSRESTPLREDDEPRCASPEPRLPWPRRSHMDISSFRPTYDVGIANITKSHYFLERLSAMAAHHINMENPDIVIPNFVIWHGKSGNLVVLSMEKMDKETLTIIGDFVGDQIIRNNRV